MSAETARLSNCAGGAFSILERKRFIEDLFSATFFRKRRRFILSIKEIKKCELKNKQDFRETVFNF
jgi:hypothetical protein